MDTVAFGFLGTTLDASAQPNRWNRWRPTVALCQHPDLLIDRLELLHDDRSRAIADVVCADIGSVSPETEIVRTVVSLRNPWDFEEMYATLSDFARGYAFDPERERYLVNLTTGTHVAQICWFLLTEARYLPGALLQLSPPGRRDDGLRGRYQIIDLDLSRYDRIADRFTEERAEGEAFLKSGIVTRNAAFNAMIAEIEKVVIRSREPVLLLGPTGAGKSQLARRIFELKKSRHQIRGGFVPVNCATLRGDNAMSALFGHKRGAFTGAAADRAGLLRAADGGLLFLDEIGELGLDEQAMILRAIEEKRFLPLGADTDAASDFQLIAGTNRDLRAAAREGSFRADLLARLDLWTYSLPGLRDRPEDIDGNLDFELARQAQASGAKTAFNKEARERYLAFATGPGALWAGNFRDLRASVTRMATLADGGRINSAIVAAETRRLAAAWGADDATDAAACGGVDPHSLDLFDRIQLMGVVAICRRARSLSEAGRQLFAVSRAEKRAVNDADRLRKYLKKFGLDWTDLQRP